MDNKESNSRTSYGAWLTGKLRDNVVKRVENRIHDTIGLPREFGEGIYVLRYQNEQKYDPHTDNCAKHVIIKILKFVKFYQGTKNKRSLFKFLKKIRWT